ncbi:uncharacterized protein [Spinacia oleracea]|uniref:Uncharacterized protein isoform X4 n=1 Tax=Spinacia oleracea TaxID=3562 RepID=A0A9R0JLG4_SPIOL|nr:uncharacterized protein LOC110778439 isoform X4 [Spinacia oleracea]
MTGVLEIFRGGNTCLFDLSRGRVLVQQSHHGHSGCSGSFASGVLEQDPPSFPYLAEKTSKNYDIQLEDQDDGLDRIENED